MHRSHSSHPLDLTALWHELEGLRAQYAQAAPKPRVAIARLRRALRAIDARSLLDRYPHIEGIIASTLLDLDFWEKTWPEAPGRRVPPPAFGVLALVGEL